LFGWLISGLIPALIRVIFKRDFYMQALIKLIQVLIIASISTLAAGQTPFSPFLEVAAFGPYGPGIGVGAIYDNSKIVKYVDGFWGGAGVFWSEESGVFEDYTETLIDLHGGALLNIPKLNEIEKLDVFAGLSIGFRSYEYLSADYSETIFGLVAGAMYAIDDTWSAGGMYSFMTNAPRLMVSYSF
jgi:hypothetical protein